jgi:magnesium transporter
MFLLYAIENERLVPVDPAAERHDVVWIDLLNPTAEEDARIEKLVGVSIPTREEMAEIEVSSRLYSENNALYMTATLLVGGAGPMTQSAPVTFILARGKLITVRYAEPGVFRSFATQVGKSDSNVKNADSLFIALIEAIVDRTADILESVGVHVDAISGSVFDASASAQTIRNDYKELLRKIGRAGDLTSKVRESLVSVGRLANFLIAECGDMHPELRERAGSISADIRSLTDHATYLGNTTVFLLDATVGLITIDQNNIIKIVSVVSVVIMPPTLIASIYGMNFRFMPELDWTIGYPLALVAMVAAASLPYWFFKRRGWL